MLHCRGGTLNTMVLAGLVIALGEVVDDAIIDVENIVRRLRLNRAAAQSAAGVSRSCSTPRSKSAAPSSTPALIVVLVFLPVFFLDGLAGTFFRPLALAYILAIARLAARRAHGHAGAVADAAAAARRERARGAARARG